MKLSSTQRLLLGLIMAVTIFASLWHLEDSPRTWFDEGIYVHVSKNVATQGIYNITLAPGVSGDMSYISTGYSVLLPIALAMKVFGPTLLVARLVMVLILICFVALVFVYVRKISGPWPALASAALVATFSAFYGHGKNVLGEVPGLLFLLLASLFFTYAELGNKRVAYFGAAMFFGLAVVTKPLFVVCLPGVLIACLIAQRRGLLELRTMLISALFVLTPILLWVLLQFSPSELGGVFAHYVNPYNEASVTKNILPNIVRLFTELTPLHFLLLATFVLVVTKYRWKQTSLSEWILLAFSVLVFSSFLRTPGWYRYFFPAHVIFMILAPVALARLNLVGHWRSLSLAVVAILICVQGVYLFTHIDRFYDTGWRDVREYISKHVDEGILYYNVPQGAFFSPEENYYQILTIREGLSYGQDLVSEKSAFNVIISGEGNDPARVKELFPSFVETGHMGSYYIFSRTNEAN